jgi:TPR repeat protein
VAKDDAEAVKWYRKAAQQNHALAQSNLGYRYYSGDGVVKDYVESYTGGCCWRARRVMRMPRKT